MSLGDQLLFRLPVLILLGLLSNVQHGFSQEESIPPIMPRDILETEAYFLSPTQYHEVKFFLNETLTHEIREEKAQYRMDDIRHGNDRIIFVTHIPSRIMIRRYAFKNGFPIGKWPCYNKRAHLRYELDFDDVVYAQRDGFTPEIDFPLLKKNSEEIQLPQFPFDEEEIESRLLAPDVLPREYRLNELIGQGDFVVRIHVDRYGVLSHAYILEGVNPTIDYMIWKNLMNYRLMRPARFKGEAINAAFDLKLHPEFYETPIQKEVRDWKRR